MNEYVKKYIHRGLVFGGFGPIIVAIVFAVVPEVSLTGGQILLAMVSAYLLAFIQAGSSVFNQIEHWPLPKSLLFHFGSLYLSYSLCYLANSWIPFEPMVLLIFTAIFVVAYFAIWITVYLCVRATSRRMNKNLR